MARISYFIVYDMYNVLFFKRKQTQFINRTINILNLKIWVASDSFEV